MNESYPEWKMSPEREKEFWEEMEICKGMRADGKDGKCIDANAHNLGCHCCPVEAGLYEPKALETINPDLCSHGDNWDHCPDCRH